MRIVVSGATGFIGRNLIPALLQEGHQITIVGREPTKIKNIFREAVNGLSWDQLNQLAPDNVDAIINLAGENIAQSRWNETTKKRIIESRVFATTRIVDWCLQAKQHKPHIYNASAIGVYGLQEAGDQLPQALTEASEIKLGKPTDFLSEVGQAWESATRKLTSDYPVTYLRFGIALQRHEGMLKKLELPFSLGLGSILGSGKQAVTWIHITDLVNAILFLLKHPEMTGPVNICAPECVTQTQFSRTLAATLHRPLFLRMPSFAIKMGFGQMGEELLLGGQHVYPARLQEQGFIFTYPTLSSALVSLYPAKV